MGGIGDLWLCHTIGAGVADLVRANCYQMLSVVISCHQL